MELSGQSVLVTGGGSGLGRAMAVSFAKAGAGIVVGDIVAQRVDEVVTEIKAAGGKAVGCVGDVSQDAYARALVKAALDTFGRLDVVCNVAGINDQALPADEMSPELWTKVIAINLTGTFLVTHAALPIMLKAGSGVILNMSSAAGLQAIAGPAYSASKHAVIGFTNSVAATYREDGIRCVALCPGNVPTNLNAEIPRSSSPRAVRRRGYRPNRPAPGTPQQIADVAVFLATEGGSYINGTSILIDGGMLAS
jgi:NAD(P)-dependent dehydrogenase (short-subunit alcohol dehydrogenase family)